MAHVIADGIGLPYGPAGFDDGGYYVRCRVCGTRCRANDMADEDAVTKSAAQAYAAHFTAAAESHRTRRPVEDCYACKGTGKVVGFGRSHGHECPCVHHWCDDCEGSPCAACVDAEETYEGEAS